MIEGKYSKKININRRIFIIIFLQLCGFIMIGLRLLFLQLFRYNKYQSLANKNRIRILSIPPTRGLIYDVNGDLMLTNKYNYRVVLDKRISSDYLCSVKKLFDILNISQPLREELLFKINAYQGLKPITIFNHILWDKVSLIEENAESLSGIYIDAINSREYLCSHLLCHAIGYISHNKGNLNSNMSGISGAERAFEGRLQGNYGYKEIEVNATGRFIRNVRIIPPTKGQDITLTINSSLQKKISEIFPPNNGVMILKEIKTGKIRSMISKPCFDNNMFLNPMSYDEWHKLSHDPNSPLINRSIQALYPAGSVFKIVTILAALESGISPYFISFCSSKPYVNGQFRCWKYHGHGTIDMEAAIHQSCNHYIYSLAHKIGPSSIIQMAKKLKLDQLSGLEDLGGEVKTFIPSPEWKRKRYKERWYLADTLNLSVGQGYISVTPIMLSNLISSIAYNGILVYPTINDNAITHQENLELNPESIDFLKKALYSAVNKPGGTAYRNRINLHDKTMSGKTGTGQVVSKSSFKDDLNKTSDFKRRNHSVFLGFYPSNAPEYSITVLIEHAGAGGNRAAALAKKVFVSL